MPQKIWVTGHRGMVGSALMRRLARETYILLSATREQLDLTNQDEVKRWMIKNRPDVVFHVGAMVGGIYANATRPADFLYNNLMIEANVLEAAHRSQVSRLIFVASNCVYPVNAVEPIKESSLLCGPLEANIKPYAVSKIAGIELCRAYRRQHGCNFFSIVPPNLYGPGDNYHPEHSHVVAGILLRAHNAKLAGEKKLKVWGDGTPRRELLYVEDLADAMAFLLNKSTDDDLINVGSGYDLSITQIAHLVMESVGYDGSIVYDSTKPNGSKGKLLDSRRIKELGWSPQVNERNGLTRTYKDFLTRHRYSQVECRPDGETCADPVLTIGSEFS